MKNRLLILGCLATSLLMTGAASAQQPDVIRLRTRNIRATVTAETYLTVSYRVERMEASQRQGEVVEIIWGDKPADFAQAEAAMRAGRYDEAAERFERALQSPVGRRWWLEPYSIFGIGEALRYARKYDDAAQRYNQLLENHKDARYVPHSHIALGELHFAQKAYDQALKHFTEVAKSEDDIGRLRYREFPELIFAGRLGMARSWTGLGRTAEAQRELNAIISDARGTHDDIYFDARRLLAYAKLTAGDIQGSISEYDSIIEEAVGRMKERETLAPEELRLQKSVARCYIGLAEAHLRNTNDPNRVRAALYQYLRVVTIFADSTPEEYADALAGAAQCFLDINQKDRAKQWYNVLKEKFPQHPGVKSVVVD